MMSEVFWTPTTDFPLQHFVQGCSCIGATVSTGAIRVVEPSVNRLFNYSVFSFEFIPGPSCDVCGAPWKRYKETT